MIYRMKQLIYSHILLDQRSKTQFPYKIKSLLLDFFQLYHCFSIFILIDNCLLRI